MDGAFEVPCPVLEDDGERPGKTSRSRLAFVHHVAQRVAYAHGWRSAPQDARYLGAGLTYDTYYVALGDEGVAIRVPHGGAERDQPDRAARVAWLLGELDRVDFRHRLPRPLALIAAGRSRTVVVQSFVPGVPLTQHSALRVDSAEALGQVAAAVHALPLGRMPEVLPAFLDCTEQGEVELEVFEDDDAPVTADALAWCRAHMPPPEPCRLVHGDLLGQNVHAFQEPNYGIGYAVLDWENACVGDPAYDLAVVTRGRRHPFGKGRGNLARLLEAYNARARHPIEPQRVHFYEACIQVNFITEAEGEAERAELRRGLGGWLRRLNG